MWKYILYLSDLKNSSGFSGDSVVKNLPASVGDMGSVPDPGRSPVLWNLEACALESVFHNKRSRCNEKPAHHNQRVASARHS